jgi:oxygen-dependent protoporphyrinogen oxidase
MPHASPVTVSLGYRREQVRHLLDGFGVLVPAAERRRALSLQFTSSLFPDRAPAGHVLLTATLGGARQPAHLTLPDDALVRIAADEAAGLLGISGEPLHASVQRWPAALPLPVSGHAARLAAAQRAEELAPRLALTGAWRAGSSLGEVMEGGVAAAERVLAHA